MKALRTHVALCSAATAGLLAASPAYACTLCHSRLAEDVRAAVFGADLWANAVVLLLPVPILLTAAAAVLRSVP